MSIHSETSYLVAREIVEDLKSSSADTVEATDAIKRRLESYACAAAGIVKSDKDTPLRIESLVWYHRGGGPDERLPETWKDRAQELEKKLELLVARLESLDPDFLERHYY